MVRLAAAEDSGAADAGEDRNRAGGRPATVEDSGGEGLARGDGRQPSRMVPGEGRRPSRIAVLRTGIGDCWSSRLPSRIAARIGADHGAGGWPVNRITRKSETIKKLDHCKTSQLTEPVENLRRYRISGKCHTSNITRKCRSLQNGLTNRTT